MHGARRWPPPVCMYAEEDTYMSYEPLCVVSSFKEEEDTCMVYEYEEEDSCMSYEDEEEDTWSHCLVVSFL
jgi:hypothetical protein